nr:hypothetical protein [Tanacetum cinerariifolium]
IKTLELYRESNKARIESLSKQLETLKLEKDRVDGNLASLLKASKNLDNLIKSQRSQKNKDGLGYSAVPPPVANLYLSTKKYFSWTGLSECDDDTVTDYSRPSSTVESTSEDVQNKNPSIFEDVASPSTPKPFIKFVKPKDCQTESKTDKKVKMECIETLKKDLETLKQEKEVVDGKLAGLLLASKDLDNLIESQRTDKSKEESSSEEDQNRNPSASKNVASPITPKQFVKFVKASDSQSKSKTDEKETPEKPPIKNAEQYRKPNKKSNVRENQRN